MDEAELRTRNILTLLTALHSAEADRDAALALVERRTQQRDALAAELREAIGEMGEGGLVLFRPEWIAAYREALEENTRD